MADKVRLIDGNALKEDFMNDYHNYMMESLRGNHHDTIRISNVIERIEDAPTIEAEPVHENSEKGNPESEAYCFDCIHNEICNYCPHDGCDFKEKAEPDNGWISVKDRLPPTGVPILIYVYNIEEMTVVSLDHDGLGFSNADEWFNIKNIHHWQPLPKAPKEE